MGFTPACALHLPGRWVLPSARPPLPGAPHSGSFLTLWSRPDGPVLSPGRGTRVPRSRGPDAAEWVPRGTLEPKRPSEPSSGTRSRATAAWAGAGSPPLDSHGGTLTSKDPVSCGCGLVSCEVAPEWKCYSSRALGGHELRARALLPVGVLMLSESPGSRLPRAPRWGSCEDSTRWARPTPTPTPGSSNPTVTPDPAAQGKAWPIATLPDLRPAPESETPTP